MNPKVVAIHLQCAEQHYDIALRRIKNAEAALRLFPDVEDARSLKWAGILLRCVVEKRDLEREIQTLRG